MFCLLLIFLSFLDVYITSDYPTTNVYTSNIEFFYARNFQDETEIEVINNLNPTLRWFKVNDAIKYLIVINEFEGNNLKSKPVIIRYFEVQDTFFVIPSLILEDGKIYSWNVRSFNGKLWSNFGKEFYFKVFLKDSKAQSDDKTISTISPGKLSPEIELINTINPVFKWFKIKSADYYNFILEKEEKPGSYKKILSSENFGTISDTFLILQGSLLKQGNLYRWRVWCKNKFGLLLKSDYRYFKVSLPKILVVPEPIYPGYSSEGKEILATTTPTFIWGKNPSASSYSVAISKKDSDGKYRLIFDSEKNFKIIDTFFILPPNIIENNSEYRWNLKVNLKDGRTLYSKRLYFKVIFEEQKTLEKFIQNESTKNELEEFSLNMEYAGIFKNLVSSIYLDEKIFISLSEFLSNLQIPFEKKGKNIFTGYINDDKNNFTIDFTQNRIKKQGIELKINPEDFIEYNEDYFVSTSFCEKFLPLKLEFDFSNLTLNVLSEVVLPVYSKYIIEQRLASLRKNEKVKTLPLLFNRERYLLNGFILDYSLSQTYVKHQRSGYFYRLAFGGELLYGDFYYSRQQFFSQNFKSNVEDINWKFIFNPNKYITQISLGDNFIDAINIYTYRGFMLTNEVVEPRKKIGNYIFQDKTDPSSLVELYINNELYDIKRSNENGDFSFEIPLNYGMSNLELRIHTLMGETKSLRRVFQIPYEFLPAGIFNYKTTAGVIKFTNKKFAYSEFSYGIADYFTLATGGEFIYDSTNKYLNYFGKSSFRILPNFYLNLFYSPKIFTKIQGSYIGSNFTSYSFEYIDNKNHKFYNPSRINKSYKGSFFLPLKLENNELGFYFNQEYFKSDFIKRYNINVNAFYLYKWLAFNLGIINENLYSNIKIIRREITGGTTINFNTFTNSNSILNRSYLSIRANYNLLVKDFQSLSVFAATTFLNSIRFQISFERLFKINVTNVSVNLFLDLPQARYFVNSNLKDVINQQISGSIGYSSQINQLYLYSEPQIGRSAIYIEGFEDRNMNEKKDGNENIVKDLNFSINSASYSKNLKDGKLILGLNQYQEYSLRVIDFRMSELNLSTEFSEFKLLTDGNRIKVIRLPFYETGEIGGLVLRNIKNEEIPVRNVKIIITNLSTQKEYIINTFSDGSFYLYGLRKGKYVIRVDENYLNRHSLKSNPEQIELEIDPTKNQLIFEELKFTLY